MTTAAPSIPLKQRLAARGLDGLTLLVVPAILFVLLLFIYPFLYGLFLSFEPKAGGVFANYQRFFSDSFLYGTIATTLETMTPPPMASCSTPNTILSAGPEMARAATSAKPARLSAERSGAAMLPATERRVREVSVVVTWSENHCCVHASSVRALVRMAPMSATDFSRRAVILTSAAAWSWRSRPL